ncbi:hypothetical protein SAMN05660330_03837 [Desulforhopalus singaporensis]|uniref:Uncharacterized protein n=1 Tax=Desulforhopalus singaporensis TaxID=91360 RepID=A0A1H0V355_9BACT|nr:hypothetical protein SAMN05660330_03837 [Desulforhopalus singaporensis]
MPFVWGSGLGLRVFDIVNSQIQLIVVAFCLAAIPCTLSVEMRNKGNWCISEWHYSIVKQIGGCNRSFGGVELGKSNLAIGINEGLVVDSADTLDCADIESILRTEIARVCTRVCSLSAEFMEVQFPVRYMSRNSMTAEPGIKGGLQGLPPPSHLANVHEQNLYRRPYQTFGDSRPRSYTVSCRKLAALSRPCRPSRIFFAQYIRRYPWSFAPCTRSI